MNGNRRLGLLATCCILLSICNAISNDSSLLWGPYRPNLYFGVRPRIPKSLVSGLIWFRIDDYQQAQQSIRHTCEQHADIHGYGWEEYDAREGGRQVIHDEGNKLDLETRFVKWNKGDYDGSWAVRINGRPRDDVASNARTTVIWYSYLESLGLLGLVNKVDPLGQQGSVTLKGSTAQLGDFSLEITTGPASNVHPAKRTHPIYEEHPLDRTVVRSFEVAEESLWQTLATITGAIKETIDGYLTRFGQEKAPPPEQIFTISHKPGPGNSHAVQKVFQGSFEFDVIFTPGGSIPSLTGDDVTSRINAVSSAFLNKFEVTFARTAPFNSKKYEAFARSMYSNLVGGIGYFYGDAIVDRLGDPAYAEENEGFWTETEEARNKLQIQPEGPYELFTSIPSRPFFPRGFLWDEGFHLLPIADWDMSLTLEIVKSWFDLIDDDGWIAREQILGPEARSKVPKEFQIQYPHYANPPTLFFILEDLIDRIDAETATKDDNAGGAAKATREVANEFLRSVYPLLKRQLQWFRRTQAGDLKSYDRPAHAAREAYRWRGRTPRHILTSGLDDYPRAQPPHPGELHVDLLSWVGMMTRSLRRIAAHLGENEEAEDFSKAEKSILRNVEALHWSEPDGVYCDATIDEYEEHVLVCHKGYVSIFPFMLGLVDLKSEKVGRVLDLIGSEDELWSPHGLRSLSKKDALYGTDENYWRSPIWVNINYLALQRLLELAKADSPHAGRARKLYVTLRKNLVDTVYESWKKTGFAWEQYNPETGEGQRTQHFTGWTSLVVKIMCMPSLKSKEHEEL